MSKNSKHTPYFLLIFVFFSLFADAGCEENNNLNENQKIFSDTLKYIQETPLPYLDVFVYDGSQNAPHSDPSLSQDTIIFVPNKSSFQMTYELAQAEYRPMLLDMANKLSPGGGVLKGAQAQEETICRQSNLYSGLIEAEALGFYPILEHGGILVKGVTFFRNDFYEFLPDRFQADVFVSAAYDCNRDHETNIEKMLSGYDKPENSIEYETGTKAKIRASCRAAKENGNDALVLGAFGCGAFKNDPQIISKWYKEVLNEVEFRNTFKLIVFAIIPGESPNFKVFHDCFSK